MTMRFQGDVEQDDAFWLKEMLVEKKRILEKGRYLGAELEDQRNAEIDRLTRILNALTIAITPKANFHRLHHFMLADVIGNCDRDEDGDIIGNGLVEDLKVMLIKDNVNFDSSEFDEKAGIQQQFLNYYQCPGCGHEWTDQWSAQCDDDCPDCGMRHISPYKSEDA